MGQGFATVEENLIWILDLQTFIFMDVLKCSMKYEMRAEEETRHSMHYTGAYIILEHAHGMRAEKAHEGVCDIYGQQDDLPTEESFAKSTKQPPKQPDRPK